MSKRKGPALALRLPDDTVAFHNANDLLHSLGVRYTRPSPHQLKIGRINYFPATGTIHVDGERKARSKRGRDALKTLLTEQRVKLGVFVAKRNAEAARRDAEAAREDAVRSQE